MVSNLHQVIVLTNRDLLRCEPEIEKNTDNGIGIILFIDELHLIMAGRGGESGGMDGKF